MINSRQKGARGERELAKLLTEAGFPAERAQQYKGGQHSADVSCPELEARGFHVEVKRTERVLLYEWLEKARIEAVGKTPVIFHKRNRGEWVAIIDAPVLLDLIKGGTGDRGT